MIAVAVIVAVACLVSVVVAIALVRSGSEEHDHAPLLGRPRQPWLEAVLLLVVIIVLAWVRR